MQQTQQQYFDKQTFYDFTKNTIMLDQISLYTTDTYNETEVSKTIIGIGIEICGAVAIQLSLIGLGKKSYGKCLYKGQEIIIKDFFDKSGIKYNSVLGSNLEPGDLTPRRLIRFYRYLIQEYIIKSGKSSYLFRKYCPERNIKNPSFIFPGYEHMAEPNENEKEVVLLIKTYKTLDSRQLQKTNITDRIIRVLVARGFSWDFLVNI